MDALKRAEQANQRGSADSPRPEQVLALEPVTQSPGAVPAAVGTATTLPELPRLEDLDSQFLAHAQQAAAGNQTPTPPAGPALRTTQAAEREAIRNAFAIKQPAGKNRIPAVILGVVSSLAVAAIGAWFWVQLRPVQGITVGSPAVVPAPKSPGAATASPAPPVVLPTVQAESGDNSSPRAAAKPVGTRPAEESRAADRASPALPPPVRTDAIRISTAHPKPDTTANDAYAAFQADRLSDAKAAYQRLLEADSRNIEALNGLAAIALREGRLDDAEAAYLRVLEADPRDPAAHAGLIGLRSQGDPITSESRIKSLLATQPDMPVLHFALGNLYARQNRWSEAQQAYFKAHAGDPENPDYLFNLAVSLDQLHQAKLAAQHYRQALVAADRRPAGFDRSRTTARLQELQP